MLVFSTFGFSSALSVRDIFPVKDVNCFDSSAGEIISKMSDHATPLAAIDYDNDGDMDFLEASDCAVLIVTNHNGNYDSCGLEKTKICELPSRNGNGESLHMGAFDVGDFNNDGKTDFITGGVQGVVRLFVNNNMKVDTPAFKDYIKLAEFGQTARGVAVADFNEDGWMDFAVSHTTSPLNYSTITIFFNQKDLTFNQEDVFKLEDQYIADLDAGDFDNDGDIDLLFTKSLTREIIGTSFKIGGVYCLLKNTGNNNFPSETKIATRGFGVPFFGPGGILKSYFGFNRINPQVTSADYDNDGDIDFLIGDNSGKVELFINNGQGKFSSKGIIHRYGQISWGLTSADFDNDGDIDFLVAALNSEGYWDIGNGNIWIKYNQLI